MLFNSIIFIAFFLPVTCLITFFLSERYGGKTSILGMLACSILFYAWWNASYLFILLSSILFNFFIGNYISGFEGQKRKIIAFAGVSVNLLLLGYYKYVTFLIEVINSLGILHYDYEKVMLPLGISFFTLQQVAYLVDIYKGNLNEKRIHYYALFVCFFPHLIAGPILHHKDILSQFKRHYAFRLKVENIAKGLTFFSIGLFKKVIIADQCSLYVKPVFSAASRGIDLGYRDAWLGALGYSSQLYFDFSAYSDMAIGLALMFGILLPINFNSPYKSRSIIEFWRRWHITLSQYLRDYIYIPLGGNREGQFRRFQNLILTMLIGGIWHGAGWTFIIWGLLHGIFLLVNNIWIILLQKSSLRDMREIAAYKFISWILTFLAVVFAWVIFRANNVPEALEIWKGMFHLNNSTINVFPLSTYLPAFTTLAGFLGIAFFAPNACEIMSGVKHWNWSPNFKWATYTGILLTISIYSINKPTEFLYFSF